MAGRDALLAEQGRSPPWAYLDALESDPDYQRKSPALEQEADLRFLPVILRLETTDCDDALVLKFQEDLFVSGTSDSNEAYACAFTELSGELKEAFISRKRYCRRSMFRSTWLWLAVLMRGPAAFGLAAFTLLTRR